MLKHLRKNIQIKIFGLGGLNEMGKNTYVIEIDGKIFIMDAGIKYANDSMYGIDYILPNYKYLEDNKERIVGVFLTHAHQENMGGVFDLVEHLPKIRVYATKYTKELLLMNGMKEKNIVDVVANRKIGFKNVSVFPINVSHSVPDAVMYVINTHDGAIVYTGDFLIDPTMNGAYSMDLGKIAYVGKKGVLALMCDSTNALRPGFTPSERTVGKTFDHIFSEHTDGRIIIATFASNVDRVQQIINTACKYKRKVIVEGRSMVNIISVAREMGYLKIPENTLISIEEMDSYTDNQLVLITTGSQGESMAALSRMAASIHRKVQIKPGDTIVFSSTPIPGNEKAVSKVINELYMKGANVIFNETHVSGHACQEEIKLMYSLIKPKYSIPVHGEYRHLMEHGKLAQSMGIPKKNVFLMESGDVLSIGKEDAKVVGKVPAGSVLVDGLGVGDVGNIVLREKKPTGLPVRKRLKPPSGLWRMRISTTPSGIF